MTNGADSDKAAVKDLLSRAIGAEPPLGIDRDEVIEHGRKRLRRKRAFEAGGVVALVVVAAVGAATLTKLAGSDSEQLPPAASSTVSAPVGPDLPLTSTTVSPPGSTSTPPLPPASANKAKELTQLMYATGVVTNDEIRQVPGRVGPPGFTVHDGQYLLEADVFRPTRQGSLQIVVGLRSNQPLCPSPYGGKSGCDVVTLAGGLQAHVGTYQGPDGEQSVFGSAVLSGAMISVSATNYTDARRDSGAPPPSTPPVLTKDELLTVITKMSVNV